jgi:Rhodopirellula transposase DDE domain
MESATVRVGPFARGGKSRVPTKAADHDFEPVATVTPVGIFLPASDELFLYQVTSKVTSDCLVDRLVDWWETVRERFAHITTLLINLDNGPESHSRRTQFMQRLLEFVQRYRITIRLAYYPPYPSRVQRDRALLGHFGTALEWRFTRYGGRRDPVCQHHDLERESSRGRIGDDDVSDRGQTDQEGDEGRGNPASANATPGQVVRGHRVSPAS